ncbi:MAG: hypothetical protein J6F30_08680 [Cellulosilyticum sp.]|nr:hypothetical protein [Cellulosilyticum sp.]
MYKIPKPKEFTHNHNYLYHTFVSINSKDVDYLDNLLTSFNNHGMALFDLIHELLQKYNIDLLGICYEEPDKYVSHPHFHLLLDLTIPPTAPIPNNYITQTLFQILRCELIVKARARGIGDFKPSMFIKYLGNGYGVSSNQKNSCPEKCKAHCLNKQNCFNDIKPKTCHNVVERIFSYNYIKNMYGYIYRDKSSPKQNPRPKQFYKFYEPSKTSDR